MRKLATFSEKSGNFLKRSLHANVLNVQKGKKTNLSRRGSPRRTLRKRRISLRAHLGDLRLLRLPCKRSAATQQKCALIVPERTMGAHFVCSLCYFPDRLHCRCGLHEPSVNAAADAEEEYAGGAESEGCACGAVATERGQGCFGLVDIHALHNFQIVVE